ncbi:MAG: PDZ domain-containing protein [Planctomycetota bacterium]|nr:PDZ domain-containing protein [Planctomycetota bacterium]
MLRCRFILVVSLLCAALVCPPIPAADAPEQAIDPAVAAVYPSLVQIQVVMGIYQNGREQKMPGTGSGAIISPDGYVVTNHHVAGHAVALRCRLANREEVPATLVGTDPLADIAVIKLDLSARPAGAPPLTAARWGNSDVMQVGDPVYAMGCPLGLSQSVTRGILANKDMMVPKRMGDTFELDGEEVGSLVKWFGHDATIQPGNSGGPLVNAKGEIVGVNEIGMGSMGGAIPSSVARPMAEEIIKSGSVRRAFFGIAFQPLLHKPGQDPPKQGVLIAGTIKGTPAEEAGLKAADIALAIGGEPVLVRFDEELPGLNKVLAAKEVGKPVEFRILRDGKEQTVSITPMLRDEAMSRQRAYKEWGFTARRITVMDAKQKQRPDCVGVILGSVTPGGPADKAVPALQNGDIIVALGGKPVQTQADFEKLSNELIGGKESVPVVVEIERGNDRYLTLVEAGIRAPQDPPSEAKKAWIGVSTQVLTRKLAKALGLEGKKGVRITHVYPGGNAEQAGLKVGDIVTHMDGQLVEASEPHDAEVFASMVRAYKPDGQAELTIIREGKPQKLTVALKPAPKTENELHVYEDLAFEFKARDITQDDRVKRKLPDTETGALLTQVDMGGWAAVGGLKGDDIVQSLNGQKIASLADLEKAMNDVKAQHPKHVVFFVKRGIITSFVEVFPVWSGKEK